MEIGLEPRRAKARGCRRCQRLARASYMPLDCREEADDAGEPPGALAFAASFRHCECASSPSSAPHWRRRATGCPLASAAPGKERAKILALGATAPFLAAASSSSCGPGGAHPAKREPLRSTGQGRRPSGPVDSVVRRPSSPHMCVAHTPRLEISTFGASFIH